MRIGLVVEQFDPRRGGLEQWSTQFAREVLARGHEVHVVSGRFGELAAGMPVVRHPLEGFHTRMGFAESAHRKLLELDLDVIHDTGAGWHCDVFQPHWGSWTALNEQKLLMLPPWMRSWKRLMIRWLPRYRQIRQLVAKQYANDGRLVLALSRRVAGDVQRFHGVKPENLRLVYNGVDTVRFSPANRAEHRAEIRRQLGIDERTTLLLIVAHNFRLKGVPALLAAVGRLAAQGRPVHLAVVGGKRIGRLGHAARPLQAQRAVTFTGAVDDVVPYYAAADAYVHPTFYDTFSLVVLEALASGLPVVTSRRNGVEELFTEGVQGYLLDDPSNVDVLAERLERLLDPVARERMGAAARRLAEEHTFDRNVDEILAAYEEVRARKARRESPWTGLEPPFYCRRPGEPQGVPAPRAARKAEVAS